MKNLFTSSQIHAGQGQVKQYAVCIEPYKPDQIGDCIKINRICQYLLSVMKFICFINFHPKCQITPYNTEVRI